MTLCRAPPQRLAHLAVADDGFSRNRRGAHARGALGRVRVYPLGVAASSFRSTGAVHRRDGEVRDYAALARPAARALPGRGRRMSPPLLANPGEWGADVAVGARSDSEVDGFGGPHGATWRCASIERRSGAVVGGTSIQGQRAYASRCRRESSTSAARSHLEI